MKTIKPIPLCSQCTSHEISSWLSEKAGKFDEDIVKNIYLELRDIKLAEGECIVCKKNKISSDCFSRILKVMNKYKINEPLKNEFTKMFGFIF